MRKKWLSESCQNKRAEIVRNGRSDTTGAGKLSDEECFFLRLIEMEHEDKLSWESIANIAQMYVQGAKGEGLQCVRGAHQATC